MTGDDAMMDLPATSPRLHAWVQFSADAVTVFSAAPDAPCQDVAELRPTPDEADAIAAALVEWSARQRAKLHANSQADLLVLL